MAADHHRTVGTQLQRMNYPLRVITRQSPQRASQRRRGFFRMFGGSAVTCAACDSKLCHFCIERASADVEIRLSFYVVAEDTIGVPLRLMLEIIIAIWIK